MLNPQIPIERSPVLLNCSVNGVEVDFEVDTGSYLSTISVSQLGAIKNLLIRDTNIKAKGYGNSDIKFIGETKLLFKYKDMQIYHNFLIVEDTQTSLLGRDILAKLNSKLNFFHK